MEVLHFLSMEGNDPRDSQAVHNYSHVVSYTFYGLHSIWLDAHFVLDSVNSLVEAGIHCGTSSCNDIRFQLGTLGSQIRQVLLMVAIIISTFFIGGAIDDLVWD